MSFFGDSESPDRKSLGDSGFGFMFGSDADKQKPAFNFQLFNEDSNFVDENKDLLRAEDARNHATIERRSSSKLRGSKEFKAPFGLNEASFSGSETVSQGLSAINKSDVPANSTQMHHLDNESSCIEAVPMKRCRKAVKCSNQMFEQEFMDLNGKTSPSIVQVVKLCTVGKHLSLGDAVNNRVFSSERLCDKVSELPSPSNNPETDFGLANVVRSCDSDKSVHTAAVVKDHTPANASPSKADQDTSVLMKPDYASILEQFNAIEASKTMGNFVFQIASSVEAYFKCDENQFRKEQAQLLAAKQEALERTNQLFGAAEQELLDWNSSHQEEIKQKLSSLSTLLDQIKITQTELGKFRHLLKALNVDLNEK